MKTYKFRIKGNTKELDRMENTSLQSEIEKFRDEFKCPQCMGHGWFQSNNGNQPTQDQCHVCYGTGTLGRGYFQSEIDRLQTELSEMKKEHEKLKDAHNLEMRAAHALRAELSEMKKEREELKRTINGISLMDGMIGRRGCTYYDTEYDSLSVAYGYNECLEHVKEWIDRIKK